MKHFEKWDVKFIDVPRYEELALPKIYKAIVDKYPDLEDYLPVYNDDIPKNWEFFWNIFNTID